MRVKISVEIEGVTEKLCIRRVVAAELIQQSDVPSTVLSNAFDKARAELFSPDGDNVTEKVKTFISEQLYLDKLKRGKDEALKKFSDALDVKLADAKAKRK